MLKGIYTVVYGVPRFYHFVFNFLIHSYYNPRDSSNLPSKNIAN
jgi:hypothetical protein